MTSLAKQLESLGYEADVDDFRDILVELHQTMYPDWTDEVLTYHPYEALRYCDAVRHKAKCKSLHDDLILSSLVQIRKSQRKREASLS